MSQPTPDQIRHDMDSPTLNHVSLCAGYGGIDLGLRRAIPSLRTVAFAEIEAFAVANLVAKMEAGLLDPAPIWTDLKTFQYGKFRGLVDILSGGYPCQPFSAAGQRRGKDDPRHLWPWIADGIAAMRPAVCFFENVEGHISLGLSDVIEDLAGMGYRTTWGIFSAAEVGAPHQRKRVFILAHRDDSRGGQDLKSPQLWSDWIKQSSSDSRSDNARAVSQGPSGSGEAMADSDRSRDAGSRNKLGASGKARQGGQDTTAHSLDGLVWPSRPGQPQFDWEPPRVVGNAQSERPAARRPEHEGQQRQACVAGASGGLGDTADAGLPLGRPGEVQQAGAVEESKRSNVRAERQAQPSLGRDADGPPGRLGDAELFVTSDNRTDELRLLGNGVVPATAERAFRLLMEQLYAANT